jgi:hypothetical protein
MPGTVAPSILFKKRYKADGYRYILIPVVLVAVIGCVSTCQDVVTVGRVQALKKRDLGHVKLPQVLTKLELHDDISKLRSVFYPGFSKEHMVLGLNWSFYHQTFQFANWALCTLLQAYQGEKPYWQICPHTQTTRPPP